MKEILPLQKLDWTNYLNIVDFIDSSEFIKEFWSPIAIMSWEFYNFKFYIHSFNDVILFYIYDPHKNNYCLSTCFYQNNFQLSNYREIILNDLKILNKNLNPEIEFNQISIQMIQDWKLDLNKFEVINYVSNYIYYLDSFKEFDGKKLQKKRNNLHHFLKQNYEIKIVNIKEIFKNELIEFCTNSMLITNQSIDERELNVYKQFINYEMDKSNKYVGIGIYLNNTLSAITLCYLRKEICEVIIERADKNIRGLYQYLISSNIKFNNINQKYMDRQDDNGNSLLAQSKNSYHPIDKIRRYYSK